MTEAIFVSALLGDPELGGHFGGGCSTRRTSGNWAAIWRWRWPSRRKACCAMISGSW